MSVGETDLAVATRAGWLPLFGATGGRWLGYLAVFAVGLAAPLLFPAYTNQMAVLCLMITFALTWDVMGGQMGYNSLGNIFFFGTGMYISAMLQIGLWVDVGAYTAPDGLVKETFTDQQYFIGLVVGIAAAGLLCATLAIGIGWIVFGLRGPYFAIGTLGVAIAAAEIITTWDWVGGGSGIVLPTFPGDPDRAKLVFYILSFTLAIATFACLKWLYSTRFGLAINAIRDDEEKAEGMGIHAGSLSFGQQRLLEFAMALMNEPTVLLLDEPTAGINPTLINGLIDRLRRANEQFGITLLIIEHNMRVIMNMAHRIYCLAHGELLASGTPEEIQNDQKVIDAYLGAN
jgi:Branched-chain amino acid transport system / permease component/Branched-chain amino acid ATP-binding cassette transporter/ABC transporter